MQVRLKLYGTNVLNRTRFDPNLDAALGEEMSLLCRDAIDAGCALSRNEAD